MKIDRCIIVLLLFFVCTINAETVIHKVQRGESLASIAEKYNTTVEEIRKLNPYVKDAYVACNLKVPKVEVKQVVVENTTAHVHKKKKRVKRESCSSDANDVVEGLGILSALFGGIVGHSMPSYTPIPTVPVIPSIPVINTPSTYICPVAPNIPLPNFDISISEEKQQEIIDKIVSQSETEWIAEEKRFSKSFEEQNGREPSESELKDHMIKWGEIKIKNHAMAQKNQADYQRIMNSSLSSSSSSPSPSSSYSTSSNNDTQSSSTSSSPVKTLCSYCNGTGKVEKDDGLSFSLGNKKYCKECGKTVFMSHYHAPCPICHGHKYIK